MAWRSAGCPALLLLLWAPLLHARSLPQAAPSRTAGALAPDAPPSGGLAAQFLGLLGLRGEAEAAPRREVPIAEHGELLETEGEALAQLADKVTDRKLSLSPKRSHQSMWDDTTPPAEGPMTDPNGDIKETPVPVPLPDNMGPPPDEFAAKDDPTTPKAPKCGEATFDAAAEAATGTALDTLLMMERLLNMTENTTTSLLEQMENSHTDLLRDEAVNEDIDRRLVLVHERLRAFQAAAQGREDGEAAFLALGAPPPVTASALAALGERLRRAAAAAGGGAAPAAPAGEQAGPGLAELAGDAARLDALAEHCHHRVLHFGSRSTLAALSPLEQRVAALTAEAEDAAAWRRFHGAAAAAPERWQLEELCDELAAEPGEVAAVAESLLRTAQSVAAGA